MYLCWQPQKGNLHTSSHNRRVTTDTKHTESFKFITTPFSKVLLWIMIEFHILMTCLINWFNERLDFPLPWFAINHLSADLKGKRNTEAVAWVFIMKDKNGWKQVTVKRLNVTQIAWNTGGDSHDIAREQFWTSSLLLSCSSASKKSRVTGSLKLMICTERESSGRWRRRVNVSQQE